MESDRSYEHYTNFEARLINNFKALNIALAKLIETGAEMDPYNRQMLRRYVYELLGLLGLQEKGAEGLLEISAKLNIEFEFDQLPPTIPSKLDFQERLLRVVFAGKSVDLPPVPGKPLARGVAALGQYDWGSIQGLEGKYTLDYLYDLAILMVNPDSYEALFPMTDAIAINRNWGITNGPHRGLVLRTLGAKFVTESGMDDWIPVRISK